MQNLQNRREFDKAHDVDLVVSRLESPDWRKIVHDHTQSGMSQKEFCAHRGININHFTYRRQLLNKQKSNPKPVFATVMFAPERPTQADSNQEVIVFTLVLPCGMKLLIPSRADKLSIQHVISALGGLK